MPAGYVDNQLRCSVLLLVHAADKERLPYSPKWPATADPHEHYRNYKSPSKESSDAGHTLFLSLDDWTPIKFSWIHCIAEPLALKVGRHLILLRFGSLLAKMATHIECVAMHTAYALVYWLGRTLKMLGNRRAWIKKSALRVFRDKNSWHPRCVPLHEAKNSVAWKALTSLNDFIVSCISF